MPFVAGSAQGIDVEPAGAANDRVNLSISSVGTAGMGKGLPLVLRGDDQIPLKLDGSVTVYVRQAK